MVHEPEKMAVLARFCEAFRALLVSVRDGAIHEAHRKSVGVQKQLKRNCGASAFEGLIKKRSGTSRP